MAASKEQGSLAEVEIRREGLEQRRSQRTSLVKRMSRRLSRSVKPKLSEEEINFISEQTGLQREKLLENYKRFLRKHPSGKIDFSGMKTMLSESIPEADTSGLVEHVWRIYDTNLDGEIDFREFMLALSVMSKGSAEDNLRQIFRLFDVNSDGRLEREELSRVVSELRKVGAVEEEDLVATAFTEMDANMDGSITQEEFVAACLRANQGSASKTLALTVVEIFVEN